MQNTEYTCIHIDFHHKKPLEGCHKCYIFNCLLDVWKSDELLCRLFAKMH